MCNDCGCSKTRTEVGLSYYNIDGSTDGNTKGSSEPFNPASPLEADSAADRAPDADRLDFAPEPPVSSPAIAHARPDDRPWQSATDRAPDRLADRHHSHLEAAGARESSADVSGDRDWLHSQSGSPSDRFRDSPPDRSHNPFQKHFHGHEHSHEHAHEYSHEHSHAREHSHEHRHDRAREHSHGHSHAHSHDGSTAQHYKHPIDRDRPGTARGDREFDRLEVRPIALRDAQADLLARSRRSADPAEAHGETLAVHTAILAANDRQAARNRAEFQAKGLLALNVLSSPGSGKTALIERTLSDLRDRYPAAVVVGDLATDNDAQRLRRSGAAVVQVTTGNVCHLEADMVARALEGIVLDRLRLLVVENVGNLVCPAAYDLGETLRVAVLSTTEGEDKPLKYPTLFKTADVVLLNKIDLAEAVDFDRELAVNNIRRIAPQAKILAVSARTGEGMAAWYAELDALLSEIPAARSGKVGAAEQAWSVR